MSDRKSRATLILPREWLKAEVRDKLRGGMQVLHAVCPIEQGRRNAQANNKSKTESAIAVKMTPHRLSFVLPKFAHQTNACDHAQIIVQNPSAAPFAGLQIKAV